MADFIHSCHRLYSNPKLFVKLSANQIELLFKWSDRGSGRAMYLLLSSAL
ncbi:hypothetical protein [Fischerella thermalis]